jgi:hypothetical protein
VVSTDDAPRASLLRSQVPSPNLVVDQIPANPEGDRRFLDGVRQALDKETELRGR